MNQTKDLVDVAADLSAKVVKLERQNADLLASLKEMVAGLLATATLGLNDGEVARLQRAEAAIANAESK